MQWVAIARTLWAHRRKVYAAATMLAPFALTTLLLVFVLFAGGGSPATNEAALTTPQCAQQMQSQGVDPGRGVQFGPGPVNNGKAVIAAGLQMRIPEKGIVLALATAMQESGMRNLANPNVPESLRIPNEGLGHDHQSVGIFQQQPWWGAIRDLMTPRIAALKFYAGLLKVGGWQQMAPTVAAQSVQQSAFPDAYADDVAAATLFYRQHLREVLTAAGPGACNTRLDGQRRDRKPLRRITSPRVTLGVQPVQAAPRQGPRGPAAALHHPDQPRSLGGVPADQDDRRIPAGLDEVASPRPGPGHHGVLGLPATEPARHRAGQRDSRLPAQERQDPRRRPRDLASAHLLPQRHLGADGKPRRPDRQPLRPRARGHHRRRLPDAGIAPPQEKDPCSTTNPR